MAVTGLFEDEDNRRTLLAWMALPLVLTFASWLAVQGGHSALRAVVWLSIVLVAFFIWIAAFSVGPYYIPGLVLLLLAGFAPWHGKPRRHSRHLHTTQMEPPPATARDPLREQLEDNY